MLTMTTGSTITQPTKDIATGVNAERMVKQMRLIDADALSEKLCKTTVFIKDGKVFQRMINDAPTVSAEAVQGWIPLSHDDNGLGTDFPYERDGEWVIVTDGKSISVERIKKDAYDHFFPNGRWFELEDVIAWMPMPEPYKEDNDG